MAFVSDDTILHEGLHGNVVPVNIVLIVVEGCVTNGSVVATSLFKCVNVGHGVDRGRRREGAEDNQEADDSSKEEDRFVHLNLVMDFFFFFLLWILLFERKTLVSQGQKGISFHDAKVFLLSGSFEIFLC